MFEYINISLNVNILIYTEILWFRMTNNSLLWFIVITFGDSQTPFTCTVKRAALLSIVFWFCSLEERKSNKFKTRFCA